MDIAQKIKELLKSSKETHEKKLSHEDLARAINVTLAGLHKMLKTDDYKVSVLIRIADFLKVPVTYFFEQNQEKSYISKENSNYENTIDALEVELNTARILNSTLEKEVVFWKERYQEVLATQQYNRDSNVNSGTKTNLNEKKDKRL